MKTTLITGSVAVDGVTSTATVSVVVSSFALGVTRPTFDTVGCRTPVASLTQLPTRELVLSKPGQVVDGVYLPNGRITIAAPGVVIRNSVIHPGAPGPDRRLIHGNTAITSDPAFDTHGALVENVTCEPGYPEAATTDYDTTGMYLIGATVRGCSIRGFVDAINADINTVSGAATALGTTVEGCYLQTQYLAWPNASTTNGTHSDCVQIAGGSGHVIRGNTLIGSVVTRTNGVVGQGVVLTPYHSAIDDVTIDSNWFVNSLSQVSAWVASTYYGGPQSQRIVITNNRHEGQCTWPILVTPAVKAAAKAISGNVIGPAGCTWNNGTAQPGSPAYVNVASAG